MGRTVLHGIDQSVPTWDKRPANPNEGTLIYQEESKDFRVYDSALAKWLASFNRIAGLYDFAESGGAQGAFNLADVPAGHVVLFAMVDVLTTFQSAGDTATIALHVEAADDIVAAIAIENVADPWDAGLQAAIPDWTVANAVKATVDRHLTMTVAVQDLTAGKLLAQLWTAPSLT